MKLYNTLSKAKEELTTQEDGKVKIYACGPTVYNYIHIGNARPLCVFDVLRRYLEYHGFAVTFVQNFTDIDDKIIRKAQEEGKSYGEVSENYIKEYKLDAKGLNIKPATASPKATENILEMINLISNIISKNYAYVTSQGDVYFRAAKFENYGKLSAQPLEDLEAGARIAVGEIKERPMDFALWKSAKPEEPFWESPWGKGRPGWHIECSAMIKRYLGESIDVHCGGQDLIFPHHENEIAQSECVSNAPLARFWLHNGYINIDNKKMSKSLGNFFTVREVSRQFGYEPIRYLMIASHYRSPINYSTDVISACKSALERLYNCKNNMDFLLTQPHAKKNAEDESLKQKFLTYKFKFIEAMDDDLNTANALSALFDLTRSINTEFSKENKKTKEIILFAKELFCELLDILGLLYSNQEEVESSAEVQKLIEERQLARQQKNWQKADEIREKLKKMGFLIEDTSQGIKITRV